MDSEISSVWASHRGWNSSMTGALPTYVVCLACLRGYESRCVIGRAFIIVCRVIIVQATGCEVGFLRVIPPGVVHDRRGSHR